MVASVHFFATADDEDLLLSHLEKDGELSFVPFGPVANSRPIVRDRRAIGGMRKLGVLHARYGPPQLIRPRDAAFDVNRKSGVFNRINWGAWKPGPEESIVDWNTTPALFWQRGVLANGVLTPSDIGSQADSMRAVSVEYERWVNRVMAWVRRRGVKGWDRGRVGPGLEFDIELPFLNAVYLLPGALRHFESGGAGRVVLADVAGDHGNAPLS